MSLTCCFYLSTLARYRVSALVIRGLKTYPTKMEKIQNIADQALGRSANGYGQKDVIDLDGRVYTFSFLISLISRFNVVDRTRYGWHWGNRL